MSQPVGKGKIVALRFVVRREDGRVLERSGREPELHLFGAGTLVPGLEEALEGRCGGEKLEVTLAPSQAYGPRQPGPGPQAVPPATFGPEVRLRPGQRFTAETPDGSPLWLYITRVAPEAIYIDHNHPYSGMTLRYELEIVSVRDATESELRGDGPRIG